MGLSKSFPAIATGVYGFPREAAARIAVGTAAGHLSTHPVPERIIFVCFDGPTVDAYRAALAEL
jgi:O-acetyl-ADP-ribose deacetylase